MRVTPGMTRAAAIGTAVAAFGVLGYTALLDHGAGRGPAPSPPARPVTPVPVSTLPGSVDAPSAVPAARRKRWLRGLAGTWTRDSGNTYFRFRGDGAGEWVAFGQKLWTGSATPRDARTFDLTDTGGHGGDYWRVTLLGGRRLLFAGTRQTFRES